MHRPQVPTKFDTMGRLNGKTVVIIRVDGEHAYCRYVGSDMKKLMRIRLDNLTAWC